MSQALSPKARAMTEDFTVAPAGKEHYNVRNDDNGNIYTISVIPKLGTSWRCTCPDHRFRSRTCKHMEKVNAVMKEEKQNDDQKNSPTDKAGDEECDCAELSGFPCWPCVRSGKRE